CDIVVGVRHGVTGKTVPNFQEEDVLARGIEEVMCISAAALEAGTHAWREWGIAVICAQQRPARQNVDELVLLRVCVTQGGDGAWSQACQVDAKGRQTEHVTQRPLVASGHTRRERFRIVGLIGSRCRASGDDRYRDLWVRHRDLLFSKGALRLGNRLSVRTRAPLPVAPLSPD